MPDMPDVVGVDAVHELLAPRFARRHLDEVLHVDRREHRAPRHVALAVVRLDAGAAPVLEHEARHLPVAEHGRAVILEEARERLGQRARTRRAEPTSCGPGGRR